jgi:hypothetical protein
MTLETLLEMDADTLAKMSDEELKAHFEPMLNVTRPDRAPKRVAGNSKPMIVQYISPQKQAMLDLLKEDGIDYLRIKGIRKK